VKIFNRGPSKSLYSVLDFEHALCKIYQVVKVQLPSNNQSERSNCVKNFCHPAFVGSLEDNPSVVLWGKWCPFAMKSMSDILLAYDGLIENKECFLPAAAKIAGSSDSAPSKYAIAEFGKPFTREEATQCLLGDRQLLVYQGRSTPKKRKRKN
jgi:hypothetical protein